MVALMLFDDEAAGLNRNRVMGRLQPFVLEGAATSPDLQKRAAWTLSLLHRQAGADSAADSMMSLVGTPSDPLVILLGAHRLAVNGNRDSAQALAGSLRHWERPEAVSDGDVGPFFRTVVHLLRAGWYAESSNFLAADRQLLWHQGYDQNGNPLREPRVEEVDWAFGTLARWRRARVIEQINSDDPRLCPIHKNIVRLWSEGDDVYAARARTAQEKFGELNCDAPTR